MESCSIQEENYSGALSIGLEDLCEQDNLNFHSEFFLTDDVDFAIIVNNLN